MRRDVQIGTAEGNGLKKAFALPLVVLIALLFGIVTGCQRQEEVQRQEVDYTVVSEGDIPQKLLETIDSKKEAEFKATFENEEGLYLVHGYGEQETGGYSIVVRELSQTEQALYFDTELLGPGAGSNPPKKPSYPYIVVKTASKNQNVVFE